MLRFAIPILMITCMGCHQTTDFPVAHVSGKVTCQGKPVAAGATVIFTPVGKPGEALAGKKAIGTVQDDGTYMLGTYSARDGAVIGEHLVSIQTEGESAKPIPCQVPPDTKYEVKPGSNTIDIEL